MAGFIILLNGKELVAVSSEGLNILSVQVVGDVYGEELADINMTGGYYGSGDQDKHLTWIENKEVKKEDEIEIKFLEDVTTSYPGKTIEGLYPESKKSEEEQEPMEDLFENIRNQPRFREKYSYTLTPSYAIPLSSIISSDDYISLGAMWRSSWGDSANISVSSNTLEGVKNNQAGTRHSKLSLGYNQSIKLCIGT